VGPSVGPIPSLACMRLDLLLKYQVMGALLRRQNHR
jgi:hypothetical protein